jgi:hypothetical protein
MQTPEHRRKDANPEQVRQLAEVMALAHDYAAAYGIRMLRRNQETRRDEARQRDALERVVWALLTTAREHAT